MPQSLFCMHFCVSDIWCLVVVHFYFNKQKKKLKVLEELSYELQTLNCKFLVILFNLKFQSVLKYILNSLKIMHAK